MQLSAYGRRGFRRLTVRWRALPGVLGIGAMRSGTSALFTALSQHPDVAAPSRKEIQFFDINYLRGTSWYRAFFPLGRQLAIDFSPSYMNHPEAASRAFQLLPGARVIAQLRDPVERAWSQYRLRTAVGTESRSFDEAIQAELAQPLVPMSPYVNSGSIPYLTAGLYAPQLERWIDLFGRDHVLVIDSVQLFSNPKEVLREIQEFSGLEPVDLPFDKMNSAPDMYPPEVLRRIEGVFEEPNAQLQKLLGRRFSWM